MFAMIAMSLSFLFSRAAAPGPCDLVTRQAATELLGQPVTTPAPSGPEADEDTGGTRTICVYQAGPRLLIVTRVEFASAAAAQTATTQELVGERLGGDELPFTITPESGLGDKAFWAVSVKSAEYIVVKGAVVLGVALGGMPQPPLSYQAQLRAATVAAMAKL